MEATHNRRTTMDPLTKRILTISAVLGALSVIGGYVLSAATNIVRTKDAINAVPLLQAKDQEFEKRLSDQERNSKMILAWLGKFGEKWDIEPPKPWEYGEVPSRRRRGE